MIVIRVFDNNLNVINVQWLQDCYLADKICKHWSDAGFSYTREES